MRCDCREGRVPSGLFAVAVEARLVVCISWFFFEGQLTPPPLKLPLGAR